MSALPLLLKLLCRSRIPAGDELLARYEKEFSRIVVGQDLPAVAFWRGRVALWAILKGLGVVPGDEVVVPAYTCEMVPIALKFAGVKCVYVDVEKHGFNASITSIRETITERTRVLLCQHTYGIPQRVHEWEQLVHGKTIAIVEDCCQLVSSKSTPTGVGTTGIAAFFSTQWNKPFSTGLGGMAIFRDVESYRRAKGIRASFSCSDNYQRARSLALQLLLHRLVVWPRTRSTMGAIYRWAHRAGWIYGTNAPAEYGGDMPSNYLVGGTNVQALVGLEQLHRWSDNVRHRRELTEFYLDHLSAMGVDTAPFKAGSTEPTLWAIALLVENKSDVLSLAGKRGLPIATWFDHAQVHVAPTTAARYDYRIGQCPRSEWMFPREIHLVTAPWVSLRSAEKAIDFLKRHANLSTFSGNAGGV